MTGFRRLPIRARLTVGFAAGMAVLLAVIGAVLYAMMGAALLDEIDTGLRSRAATIEAGLPASPDLATPTRGLIESHEAFAQLASGDGRVIESSPGLPARVVAPATLARLRRPTYFDRRVPRVQDTARILAVPVTNGSQRFVVIVGSSLSDRTDALRLVTWFFVAGGPVALVVASTVGWIVAGAALRPVERMRRQAAAISASGPDRRLDVPEPADELHRLAATLNEMLARLDDAMRAERRFLDDASHELRTPLTALKTELELALRRPRTNDELTRALASASEEADRLARMADDLLLLSRAHSGHLPVRPAPASLRGLLDASANLFRTRAANAGVDIVVNAPDVEVDVDAARLRQALDNLLDNALRFSRHTVAVRGRVDGGSVRIEVEDDGPGFAGGFETRAFVPFVRVDGHGPERHDGGGEGAGLGLAIVKVIADSHNGTVTAENRAGGGARVTLTVPAGGDEFAPPRSSPSS